MPRPRRQSGVALAVVVWFIAGMALLSAGIVLSARMDMSLARIHINNAQAGAAADGAIRLFMADLSEGRFSGSRAALPQERYRVGESWVSVVAVPVELLLDANSASDGQWVSALQRARAVSPGREAALADAIVQWRNAATGGMGRRRIESTEDLLSVQGLNRAGWDRLRDYVTVLSAGDAPQGFATMETAGEQKTSLLTELAPATRAGAAGMLAPPAVERAANRFRGTVSGTYRIDAMIAVADQTWLRRRWIAQTQSDDNLPWRTLRTEPVRMVSAPRGRGV